MLHQLCERVLKAHGITKIEVTKKRPTYRSTDAWKELVPAALAAGHSPLSILTYFQPEAPDMQHLHPRTLAEALESLHPLPAEWVALLLGVQPSCLRRWVVKGTRPAPHTVANLEALLGPLQWIDTRAVAVQRLTLQEATQFMKDNGIWDMFLESREGKR